jgi:hypothetical protein
VPSLLVGTEDEADGQAAKNRTAIDIVIPAWGGGRVKLQRFRGHWLVEPVSDTDQPALEQAWDAHWAVGLDEDGWWVFYRHFPTGGLLPPLLTFCPSIKAALSQGVPSDVVDHALDLLARGL